jgi:hypothetical protein
MTAEGNELQSILDTVARLGKEVEEAKPGAPELAVVLSTVTELRERLGRVRSVIGSLIPDSNGEPEIEERTAADLERALDGLHRAAEQRQTVG